ncbi:MAG: N-acetyltransferase [Phycisphaerales bacterium]|jgi:RimJ/RimL family protein N-acetyltransferase
MGDFAGKLYNLRPTGRCLVRSARPADAARVLSAAREVFATTTHTLTQLDEFTLTEDQERSHLETMLAAPDSAFFIALQEDDPDGPVLGMADVKRPRPRRKLRHSLELGMSVISPWRGRGVGTALMDACVTWARIRSEIELITLAVYADNAAGLALYRRFGFVQYALLPGGLKHDDGSRWDQVFMYLDVRGHHPAQA